MKKRVLEATKNKEANDQYKEQNQIGKNTNSRVLTRDGTGWERSEELHKFVFRKTVHT